MNISSLEQQQSKGLDIPPGVRLAGNKVRSYTGARTTWPVRRLSKAKKKTYKTSCFLITAPLLEGEPESNKQQQLFCTFTYPTQSRRAITYLTEQISCGWGTQHWAASKVSQLQKEVSSRLLSNCWRAWYRWHHPLTIIKHLLSIRNIFWPFNYCSPPCACIYHYICVNKCS